MASFNITKLNLTRSKSSVMMLAVCFSIMVLFGSPLHDHDLDSSHVDLDCISCHLVHSNIGLDHQEPDIYLESQEIRLVKTETTYKLTFDKSSISSRAPPLICWSFFTKYKKTFWLGLDISLVPKIRSRLLFWFKELCNA